MNNLTSVFKGLFENRFSAKVAILIFAGFALTVALAPNKVNYSRAEEPGCTIYDQSPVFNPYPVTWSNNPGVGCQDLPVISAGVHGAGQWTDNVNARVGDSISVRIYVHNGAAVGTGLVMHDAQYTLNTDNTSYISATLSASNADSKMGRVNFNLPQGAHLEISQSDMQHYYGDIGPCFDNAPYPITFTVTVVGPQVSQNPTGQINASTQYVCLANGEMSGNINWSTSNSSSVEVVLEDITTGYTNSWYDTNGNNNVDWLTPGEYYKFTLYDTSSGSRVQLGQPAYIDLRGKTCGGSNPVTPNNQATGAIDFSYNGKVPNLCQVSGTVTWSTNYVDNVKIYVKNNRGSEIYFAAYDTLSQTVEWFTPGETYQFILRGDNGFYRETAEKVAPSVNCGQVAGAQQSGSIDFNYGGKVEGLCQVYGTINWTTSNVDNVKVYVKDTTTGQQQLFGAYDNWSQTVNWFTPGESYQFIMTGDGGFSKQTAVKTAPQVNCSTPTVTPTPYYPTPTPVRLTYNATATATATAHATVSCPSGAFASADASASATATGTSNISQADAQNNANQAANSMYSSVYADAYAKAQAQATCGPTPTATVTPTPQVCLVNNNAALNAGSVTKQGSTYSAVITWSFTGNHPVKLVQVNPGYTNEILLTTTSQNSGSYTVTGLSAASSYIFKLYDTNATCGAYLTSTSVNTPANPGQLTCSVGVSTVASGQQAIFSANGGSAPYTWSGDGTPSSFNGSIFNPSYINNTYNPVTHNVTLTSGDGQSTNCGVVVNGQTAPVVTPTPVSNGNCVNNAQNSCNNNTNTNTSTNNGSTNSSNQNNNSNINGNNNTVTQQNNNCVNNSCNNVVYMSTGGTVIPANQFSQLAITKMVSTNGTGFQNSVSANAGQTVQFQIVVTNTGNAVANNVRLTDNLPSGLTFVNGSVNGGYNSNYYNNNYYNNSISNMNLGNLAAGQSVTVTFSATVNYNTGSIQNVASASSDNAGSVQASAWVFVNPQVIGCTVNCGSVQGSSVNLTYSKKAYNDTKGADASSVVAAREDYITYTLTVTNNGNAAANSFVITDDLSQVLPYADVTDNGGGSVSGNVITYPGITVPAGGSVSRSFKVRVKYALASNLSYTMTNTYGNTITIRINTPQVLGAFTAPKTGADTMGVLFSTFFTAGAVVFKKRKDIMQLIFT